MVVNGENETKFEGPIHIGSKGIHELKVGMIYHHGDDVFIVVREGHHLVPVSIKSLIRKTSPPGHFTPLTKTQKAHGAFCIPVWATDEKPTIADLDIEFGEGEGSVGITRPSVITNDTPPRDILLWIRTHGIWMRWTFQHLKYPIPEEPTGKMNTLQLPYIRGRVPNITTIDTGTGRIRDNEGLWGGSAITPASAIKEGAWGLNKDVDQGKVNYADADLWVYGKDGDATNFGYRAQSGTAGGSETASSADLNPPLPNLPVIEGFPEYVDSFEDLFGVDEGSIGIVIEHITGYHHLTVKVGGAWWSFRVSWRFF